MVARLHSVAFCGIEAIEVEVEVDVARRGFSGTILVGLPDAAVKESIERVRSALDNSGYEFPRHKAVINLAPADVRKEGPAFDLAIALGVLLADGALVADEPEKYLAIGELALDGRVRPVTGSHTKTSSPGRKGAPSRMNSVSVRTSRAMAVLAPMLMLSSSMPSK